MASFIIKNQIDSNGYWKGMGNYFDSLGEIICEFIDNSISNFTHHDLTNRSILLKFQDCSSKVKIQIEDTGTGIKNLEAAFSIGSHEGAETYLNEHGFGFKHALASANSSNDNWCICTCTDEDKTKLEYTKIEAPFLFESIPAETISGAWIGEVGMTGTIIKFSCQKEMFNTIRHGLRGNYSFSGTLETLAEYLGFVYAGVLSDAGVHMVIESIAADGNPIDKMTVKPIEPMWDHYIGPKNGKDVVDLGNGNVTIEYHFGMMLEHTDNRRYYKKNLTSSGTEIRINGRLMTYNVFKEIWLKESHPAYNAFLVQLNIKNGMLAS